MIDLRQKELSEWQTKNFGPVHDPMHILQFTTGMAEELGELCHHVLKGVQGIRGGKSGINKAEIADGFCDVIIYGLQLLSCLNIDAEEEYAKVVDHVLARDWKKNPAGDGKEVQK